MNPLLRWNLDPLLIGVLALIAAVYMRGWSRARRQVRSHHDTERLAAFLFGLLLLFLASDSPLDVYDDDYLWVHMTQHMLLMMFAPPLLLMAHPVVPLVRGLPKKFVRKIVRPISHAVAPVFGVLSAPPLAWILFAANTIAWHVPWMYELALNSEGWHSVEHACFFWTGILFWWPVVSPTYARRRWPLWASIPYLVFSDLVNTALSAILIFSGRVLYPSYLAARKTGMPALDDQVLAGAIMWVPGSLVYLIPAIVIAMRLLSPARPRQYNVKSAT